MTYNATYIAVLAATKQVSTQQVLLSIGQALNVGYEEHTATVGINYHLSLESDDFVFSAQSNCGKFGSLINQFEV